MSEHWTARDREASERHILAALATRSMTYVELQSFLGLSEGRLRVHLDRLRGRGKVRRLKGSGKFVRFVLASSPPSRPAVSPRPREHQ